VRDSWLTHTDWRSKGCFVAAGYSLRRTGETPVPPEKVLDKYSIGRNSLSEGHFTA
jgi:hypothetical protein